MVLSLGLRRALKSICKEYWRRDKQIKSVEPHLRTTTSVDDACRFDLASIRRWGLVGMSLRWFASCLIRIDFLALMHDEY